MCYISSVWMQTAWPYLIGKHRNKCIDIFLFGEQTLPKYHTCDVGLSNSMAEPMKLRCVFNKVFLVSHWHDILNCSCKWLYFSNSYRCIGLEP